MDQPAVVMMSFLGGYELFIIVGLGVLLFGAKKIPELMRGMGQGVKEFKKGLEDISEEPKKEETVQK